MALLVSPGTTSNCLHAGPTVPDTNSLPLHFGLAAEGAGILGVLADFNLFHHLPKGCAITGTIFTHNPHLLGALGL